MPPLDWNAPGRSDDPDDDLTRIVRHESSFPEWDPLVGEVGVTPRPNDVPDVIHGGRLGYLGGLALTPAEVEVSPAEIVVTCGPRRWILRQDDSVELVAMKRLWGWKFHWMNDGRLSQEYVYFGVPGDVTRIRTALYLSGWRTSPRRWKSFRWGSDQ